MGFNSVDKVSAARRPAPIGLARRVGRRNLGGAAQNLGGISPCAVEPRAAMLVGVRPTVPERSRRFADFTHAG
jgi:hypothetical protein